MSRMWRIRIAAHGKNWFCAFKVLGAAAVAYWSELPHAWDVITGPFAGLKIALQFLVVAYALCALFDAADQYSISRYYIRRARSLQRKLKARARQRN